MSYNKYNEIYFQIFGNAEQYPKVELTQKCYTEIISQYTENPNNVEVRKKLAVYCFKGAVSAVKVNKDLQHAACCLKVALFLDPTNGKANKFWNYLKKWYPQALENLPVKLPDEK